MPMASTPDLEIDFREFAEYISYTETCRLFSDLSNDISTYIGIFEPASISNGEPLIMPSAMFKDQSLPEVLKKEAELSPKEQTAEPLSHEEVDSEKEIISQLVSPPGDIIEDWRNSIERVIFNDESITKPTTDQVQSGVSLFSHSDRTRVSKSLRTDKSL